MLEVHLTTINPLCITLFVFLFAMWCHKETECHDYLLLLLVLKRTPVLSWQFVMC